VDTERVHQDKEDSLASESQRSESSLSSEGQRVEKALVSVGQRRINLMWESTQRGIAIGVMATFLIGCLLMMVGELIGKKIEMPPSLAGTVGYVIGAYFARTNHEKTGGVGIKPRSPVYEEARR
jgi:xanthine/uracil permease